MWAVPIFVMTAISGAAISERRLISPGWFIPISRTMISSSPDRSKIVMGRPMSLLKFPLVEWILNRRDRTAAIISRQVSGEKKGPL